MQESWGTRSVLIVSQKSLLRIAIQSILAAMDLDALGEAVDRTSAALLIRAVRPAVIIVDFGCAFNQAVASYVRWLLAHPHRPKVLAICTSGETPGFADIRAEGCWLLLTPEVDAAEFAAAVSDFLEPGSPSDSAPRSVRLTPRQREILLLVATGRSNAEIGKRLVIAPGTVKRHLNDAFAKLNARSRIDAVNRARSLGLMS